MSTTQGGAHQPLASTQRVTHVASGTAVPGVRFSLSGALATKGPQAEVYIGARVVTMYRIPLGDWRAGQRPSQMPATDSCASHRWEEGICS